MSLVSESAQQRRYNESITQSRSELAAISAITQFQLSPFSPGSILSNLPRSGPQTGDPSALLLDDLELERILTWRNTTRRL